MSTKITSPVEGFTGEGPGGTVFSDGVAYTDNEAAIAYFQGAGYGVTNGGGHASTDRNTDQVDARDVPIVQVGGPLRDAAVDPRSTDFLPPVNAGKADPHGPQVVAPGIHGIESQVIRPGQVYVQDLAAQQQAEMDQAEKLLVHNQSVDEALPTFERADEHGEGGSDTGPLGLSDPGRVAALDTGNSAEVEVSTLPDGTADERDVPAGNASLEVWQDYARAQGATEEDLDGKTRNQLRDLYA